MEKLNITLNPQQKIFFTSDHHFGHRNILNFCHRPFENEKHMAEELVRLWNETVGVDDYVFSLGDFSWWTDRHSVKKIVNKLNGKKYFIPGNHCTRKMYELCDPTTDLGTFHLCEDITVLYLRGEEGDTRFTKNTYEIVLCHYPLATYSHIDRGALQFFGHIHSFKDSPMTEFDKTFQLKYNQQFDVGCDRHDYKPVEFFKLLKEMEDYKYWDLHLPRNI